MQIQTPARANAMCMLAAIAGLLASDCDKSVWAAVGLKSSSTSEPTKTPTTWALGILFVST